MFGKPVVRCVLAMAVMAAAIVARADVFNMPGGQTSLQMVNVGDPGNAPDANGCGAVADPYSISKYEVTIGQYTQFLNAVAKADPYMLYCADTATTTTNYPHLNMAPGNAAYNNMPTAGIVRTGTSGSYSYAVAVAVAGTVTGTTTAANYPMFDVSWANAARFCNWLQNGQPTSGAENLTTTESGSYYLNGLSTYAFTYTNGTGSVNGTVSANATQWATVQPTSGAKYFLPTDDQWYKAAYYDPNKNGPGSPGYWLYPTKSDVAPSNVKDANGTNNANFNNGGSTDSTNRTTPVGYFANSPSPYGTFDQGGNDMEWTSQDVNDQMRGLRGGNFNSNSNFLSSSYSTAMIPTLWPAVASGYPTVGFRIATPEPGSLALLVSGALSVLVWWRRRS